MASSPPRNDEERDFAHQRALMVERHVAARGITDPRILQAMREVPRHRFVPQNVAAKAYGAGALPIGAKQTISQPYIVARMIELLELRGNEKVLEIGTGTGYQAVVLSKLCAKVFSIERVNELGLKAAELFRELKVNNAAVKVFDGTYGWSDQAPFDRIIVAAAAPQVPEPLLQQLTRTGRMVIPIGSAASAQRLARVSRVGTGVQIATTAASISGETWFLLRNLTTMQLIVAGLHGHQVQHPHDSDEIVSTVAAQFIEAVRAFDRTRIRFPIATLVANTERRVMHAIHRLSSDDALCEPWPADDPSAIPAGPNRRIRTNASPVETTSDPIPTVTGVRVSRRA